MMESQDSGEGKVSVTDEEVQNDDLAEMAAPCVEVEDEEALPHSEILDIFEEGLARLVQDPLLCDLPIQVTLEEVNSQIALEYGQAMTVRVLKADGETMPIVVVQNATVLDLKKAIRRFMELKQQREGGVKHDIFKEGCCNGSLTQSQRRRELFNLGAGLHSDYKTKRQSDPDLASLFKRRYVWRTYHLVFQGDKLEDDKMRLKDYGIRNRDEVTFMKRLRKK